MAIDASGNIYVCGTSGGRATLLAYAPDGTDRWSAVSGEPFGSLFTCVVVSSDGSSYAIGTEFVSHSYRRMLIDKYSSDGVLVWQTTYDLEGLGTEGIAAEIAPNSDLLVAAAVVASYPQGEPHENIALLRYGSDGSLLWMRQYDGPIHETDWPTDLVVDQQGSAFVVGYTDTYNYFDYVTAKYTSDGTLAWLQTHDGPFHDNDFCNAVALSKDESVVYVTGKIRVGEPFPDHDDWATIEHDAATGAMHWIASYGTGPDDYGVGATDILPGDDGTVYVVGHTEVYGQYPRHDSMLAAYNSEGKTLWRARSGRPGMYESLSELKWGPDGSLLAVGRTTRAPDEYPDVDCMLRAYSAGGQPLWQTTYGGTANYSDGFSILEVGSDGGIYASGRTLTPPADYDWVTIKYRLQPVNVEWHGLARQVGCSAELQWTAGSHIVSCEIRRREEGGVDRIIGSAFPADDDRYLFSDRTAACATTYEYTIAGLTRSGLREHLGTLHISLTALSNSASKVVVMPNPTTGPTSFHVPLADQVPLTIRICDVHGRTVRSLELGSGARVVDWDGLTADTNKVPSGVYYYQILDGSEAIDAGSLVIAR
jgi:hypothetical protein